MTNGNIFFLPYVCRLQTSRRGRNDWAVRNKWGKYWCRVEICRWMVERGSSWRWNDITAIVEDLGVSGYYQWVVSLGRVCQSRCQWNDNTNSKDVAVGDLSYIGFPHQHLQMIAKATAIATPSMHEAATPSRPATGKMQVTVNVYQERWLGALKKWWQRVESKININ